MEFWEVGSLLGSRKQGRSKKAKGKKPNTLKFYQSSKVLLGEGGAVAVGFGKGGGGLSLLR